MPIKDWFTLGSNNKSIAAMVCPRCKEEISIVSDSYYCTHCNTRYPFLCKSIPILLPDPSGYIVGQLFKFWKYIEATHKELEQVNQAWDASTRTDNLRVKIIEAIKTNLQIPESIQSELSQLVSLSDIRKYLALGEQEQKSSYTFNYEYLRRDWTWQPESEEEIKEIKNHLKKPLNGVRPLRRALFVGAGLARIPCELSSQFEEVYAVDNEITMAYLFDRVRKEDIEVCEINFRNSETNADLFRHLNATSRAIPEKDKRKVTYFIGDAVHLPFREGFFDAVISIYFTDVLPLYPLLKETRRVLRNDGVFIHFGPLEYHFASVANMLSLQEVKTAVQRANFNITHEARTNLSHCKTPLSASIKIYTDWVLCAAKNPAPSLNGATIISCPYEIEYVQSGQVIGNHTNGPTTSIRLKGGELLKTSEQVVDILKAIGRGCSLDQLIQRLKLDFQFDGDHKQGITDLINSLEAEGFITLSRT